MLKSLINVPVALNVFIRPYELRQVFNVIKQAKPSILFLISDGPRENVETDKENILKCRAIVEDIDWECNVYKIYSETNKGMYRIYFDAQDYIFRIVDRCIFLEDDVLVSVSFFKFCEVLLEKYKDDLRVHYITGLNYMGEYTEPEDDYFFCGEGSIWGYAIWKRTYESQNLNYINSKYAIDRINLVTKQLKKGYHRKVTGYVNNPTYGGHIPGPEFYKNLLRFSQNQVYIVPTKNMVSNIGVGHGSTHSSDDVRKLPKATQKLFNTKLYEYEFPLKHPKFIIRDLKYEKYVNRVLAWNHPLIILQRKLSALFRNLYFGDFNRVWVKMHSITKKTEEK